MIYKHLLPSIFILMVINQGFSQNSSDITLSLDSCVQIALKNNYELKVFEQNKNISLKQYQIQKATLFPTIDLSSEYSFTNQFESLDNYNAGNASVQLYQTIWQNGKIKSAIKQAEINIKASEIVFSINKSDIAYLTIASYINLLQSQKLKALTAEMLNRFKVTVEAAKERYKLGVSKRSDVLKAETEYANIEYLLIQISTSAKIAEQNLLKELGLKQGSSIKIANFLRRRDLRLESLKIDSLTEIANNSLPELKLIAKRIEQQEQSVLVQKRSRYPEFGAFASYNWSDNPLYDKEFYGTGGLSLRLNLFTGFQKRNLNVLEKVKLNQLNFEKDEIKRTVINEIQIALLQLIEAGKKIENATTRIKSSSESLKVTTEEYLQEMSSMLELVNAQYIDFEAKQSLIDAYAKYQLAAAKLKRKAGLLTLRYNL